MNKLIESFERVQKIPYRCRAKNFTVINEEVPYANCGQKRRLLKQKLESLGFECRNLDAIFNWRDLPIPEEILKILKNSETFQKHHLLEVKIGENYLKVDSTWNLELEKLGFPVTKFWDGNSDTEQITKGKIFFYNPLVKNIWLPYFPEERIKFSEGLNQWLGERL